MSLSSIPESVVNYTELSREELVQLAERQASQLHRKGVQINGMEALLQKLTGKRPTYNEESPSCSPLSRSNSNYSLHSTIHPLTGTHESLEQHKQQQPYVSMQNSSNLTNNDTSSNNINKPWINNENHTTTSTSMLTEPYFQSSNNNSMNNCLINNVMKNDNNNNNIDNDKSTSLFETTATAPDVARSHTLQDENAEAIELELVTRISELEDALSKSEVNLNKEKSEHMAFKSKVEDWKRKVMQTMTLDQQTIFNLQNEIVTLQRQIESIKEELASAKRSFTNVLPNNEHIEIQNNQEKAMLEIKEKYEKEIDNFRSEKLNKLQGKLSQVSCERDEAITTIAKLRESSEIEKMNELQVLHDEMNKLQEKLSQVSCERDEAITTIAKLRESSEITSVNSEEVFTLKKKMEQWKAKVKAIVIKNDEEKTKLRVELKDREEENNSLKEEVAQKNNAIDIMQKIINEQEVLCSNTQSQLTTKAEMLTNQFKEAINLWRERNR